MYKFVGAKHARLLIFFSRFTTMTILCRGGIKSGTACDCEAFSPPSDGGPLMCAECGHGKSKHDPTHLSQPDKNSVMKIFHNIKSSGPPALQQGRAESLHGYTKSTGSGHASTSKVGSKAKAKLEDVENISDIVFFVNAIFDVR
jgi:hypothetical protein